MGRVLVGTLAALSLVVGAAQGWADEAAATPPTSSVPAVSLDSAGKAQISQLLASGKWNGQAYPGLDLEETQRFIVYGARLSAATTDVATSPGVVRVYSPNGRDVLGDAAYADWMALAQLRHSASVAPAQASFDSTGPISFYVPAGANIDDAATAAGVKGPASFEVGPPDARGGKTYTTVRPCSQIICVVSSRPSS